MTETGWDTLAERARGAAEYRRAWFLSLIRQGRAAEEAGRAALAAHCRARVEAELAALGSASAAPSSEAKSAPKPSSSAFAALAARRDGAARARVLALLERHAERLSSAERAAYRAALDAAPDAQVSELRRRLVDRLLRAARYRRQAAGLAAWKPVPSDAIPAGPYNDYRALEQAVHRVAATGPSGAEWAAEFFDLYAGMGAVRRTYGEMLVKQRVEGRG